MFQRLARPVALFAESVLIGFSFAVGWVLAMSLLTIALV